MNELLTISQNPGLVRSQLASAAWQEQCLESKDERIYVLTLIIHGANNLLLRGNICGTDTQDDIRVGSASSFDSFMSTRDALVINAYCVVTLYEPRTKSLLLKVGFVYCWIRGLCCLMLSLTKAKTPILRDSLDPSWEEEFVFGNDRNYPIRGNEILQIAV